MKNFLILLILLGGSIFFSACQKNIDAFLPDGVQTAPDTIWQNTITAGMPVISLKNDLKPVKASDSFSYNNTGIVFSSGSLSLSVPANGLINSAAAFPAGTVKREWALSQKKGDIIAFGMPTVSGGRLMISGGAFFMGLKNGNDELFVSPGNSLNIKYANNATLPGMMVYNGTEDINGFNWLPNPDVVHNKVNITANGYEVLVNTLQWVQAAYLFDTTGIPQTVFSVKLPSNYTNTNTVAYISFNDMQCVAGMAGNTSLRTFVSGDLPVNRAVTIVVISKQAGDYYLGVQQTTTTVPTSGSGAQEIIITPVKRTLADIRSYLNNL